MNFKQISKSGTEQVNQLCFHSYYRQKKKGCSFWIKVLSDKLRKYYHYYKDFILVFFILGETWMSCCF